MRRPPPRGSEPLGRLNPAGACSAALPAGCSLCDAPSSCVCAPRIRGFGPWEIVLWQERYLHATEDALIYQSVNSNAEPTGASKVLRFELMRAVRSFDTGQVSPPPPCMGLPLLRRTSHRPLLPGHAAPACCVGMPP